MPKIGRRKKARAVTPRYLVSWADRLIALMRARGADFLSLKHADGHGIELRLGDAPPTDEPIAEAQETTLQAPPEPDDGRLRTSWGA